MHTARESSLLIVRAIVVKNVVVSPPSTVDYTRRLNRWRTNQYENGSSLFFHKKVWKKERRLFHAIFAHSKNFLHIFPRVHFANMSSCCFLHIFSMFPVPKPSFLQIQNYILFSWNSASSIAPLCTKKEIRLCKKNSTLFCTLRIIPHPFFPLTCVLLLEEKEDEIIKKEFRKWSQTLWKAECNNNSMHACMHALFLPQNLQLKKRRRKDKKMFFSRKKYTHTDTQLAKLAIFSVKFVYYLFCVRLSRLLHNIPRAHGTSSKVLYVQCYNIPGVSPFCLLFFTYLLTTCFYDYHHRQVSQLAFFFSARREGL